MAEMNELLSVTYMLRGGGEETLAQHCVATLAAGLEGVVDAPSGAGAGNIAGVLRDTSLKSGEVGTFQVCGIARVKAAEAISVGDTLIVADNQGRVKPKGTGAHDSGVGIVGRAISAATTQDSIVKCILTIPAEYSS